RAPARRRATAVAAVRARASRPRTIGRRLAASGDRRPVRVVEPRCADRAGQPPPLRADPRERGRPRRPCRRACARPHDRHRSLQARQRRPRPSVGRPRAEGDRGRPQRVRAADGHRRALRRRGVRDDPAELPAVVRAGGRRADPRPRRRQPDPDRSRRGSRGHRLDRRRVRAAVGAVVAAALGRARRPAALPRQVGRPQPRLPRAAYGLARQRRGEGSALRHLDVRGARMKPAAAVAPKASVLAVTSGKGGVGKTFFSANLAAALARRGERVLVLDADLGLANLDVVLNLHPKITLHDVFTGKASLEEAILPAPGGFSVLLAGSGLVEYSRLTPHVREQLVDIIERVAPRFDRILLDTGAGISDVVLHAISLADDVLVIATPEPTSMTDAYATIKLL